MEAATLDGLGDVEDPLQRIRIAANVKAELAAQKAEQERALSRMERLDEEKERMKEAERNRDEELRALDASRKSLSHDLERMQRELRDTRAQRLADRARGIDLLKEDTELAALKVDGRIHSIPEQARLARRAAAARQLELDERRHELRSRYLDEVDQRSAEHAKELLALQKSWEQRLEEVERQDRELVDRAHDDLTKDVNELHQLQKDYLQVCERIFGLAGHAANPWDVPPDVRQKLLALMTSEESIQESADSIPAHGHGFKVEQLVGDEGQVEQMIRELPASVLSSLCLELRERAREAFSWHGEHAAIHEEAVKALDDEATLKYVEQLRRLRDEGRAALAGSEERSRLLRIELELQRTADRPLSAKRSSRTPSSLPHAISATRTGPSSRKSSRPTSTMTRSRRTIATSSRPTTAQGSRH